MAVEAVRTVARTQIHLLTYLLTSTLDQHLKRIRQVLGKLRRPD